MLHAPTPTIAGITQRELAAKICELFGTEIFSTAIFALRYSRSHSQTRTTQQFRKSDYGKMPHALGKCGLFENVETNMQSFSAFYEDAAKTEAAARLEGYDGENGSLMDFVEPSDYLTGKRFQNIVEAEDWLKSEIAAMKTVFGCGTIRKLESATRRCRYCTCRGVKVVHEYTVDDTGIVEDETLEDDCVD